MKSTASVLSGLVALAANVAADPTWPAPTDDLEEIMYQLHSYGARKFADNIFPCSTEASGPGRQNAAEWLRTAFHDMSTANTYQGFGGLDASLQYELNSGENIGTGFVTTFKTFNDFYSPKTSLSDIIAAGAYASVRSCGGLVIPVRAGRVDATAAGNLGVPQPGNDIGTFQNQFLRMGFSNQEMIQVTACGHSIGGVHSADFPILVPASSVANGEGGFDSTVAAFDNKIITEYLSSTTTDPLIVGPASQNGQNSDFRIFNSDGNVTMKAMADPNAFQTTCQAVLTKMIEVVPPGVTLGDAITPYACKPYRLMLTVNADGSTLYWQGAIRIRTTDLPVGNIASMTINYKNRNGGSTCAGAPCVVQIAQPQGVGTGFDDEFTFYQINKNIPAADGISSFTVTLNLQNMAQTTMTFDNNGQGYPLQDAIIYQQLQSCLTTTTGATTLVAAVRNDLITNPVTATISYKTDQTNSNVAKINTMTANLASTSQCAGYYTLFSVQTTIPGQYPALAYVDFTVNGQTDGFRQLVDTAGMCAPLNGASCKPVTGGSTSTTSSSTTSSSSSTSSAASSSTSSSATSTSSTTSTTVSSTTSATSTSSTTPSTTVSSTTSASTSISTALAGYKYVSCWNDVPNAGPDNRAIVGASYTDPAMTLELCASKCAADGYYVFGTEYGDECYCGDSILASTTSAPEASCNMACAGDAKEMCGGSWLLNVYSSTASMPAPTATLVHVPSVGTWGRVGCQTDDPTDRTLEAVTAEDTMTNEICAGLCEGYKYFGTEYARECWCGNDLGSSSTSADSDCNMPCMGNAFEYCGGSNRLDLYQADTASTATSTSTTAAATSTTSSSSTSTSAAATSTSSSASASVTGQAVSTTSTTSSAATSSPTTIGHVASVGDYTFKSCWTDLTDNIRALDADMLRASDMSPETCATFCAGYQYFGLEYGDECWCGVVPDPSSAMADLADCAMPCAGDSLAYCGDANRMELYENTAACQAQSPLVVGPYDFVGCQVDLTNWVRTLAADSLTAKDMTAEKCASFCQGYTYFGVEFGDECYCDNKLYVNSAPAAALDCNMICAGDSSELCGSANRLSLYKLASA